MDKYYYVVNLQVDGEQPNLFLTGIKDIAVYNSKLELITEVETNYEESSLLEVRNALEEKDIKFSELIEL